MARITDKVKIYIHLNINSGHRKYHTHDLTEHCGSWLALVGTVDAVIDFDEASLIDPRTAQLQKAERDLEAHRAEFAVKERQLLDRVESLRALPHLGVDRD